MAPVFQTGPFACREGGGRGLPFDFARYDDGASVWSVLRGYARVIDGCEPVGFAMPGEKRIGVRNMAIPVVSGVGRIVGELHGERTTQTEQLRTEL